MKVTQIKKISILCGLRSFYRHQSVCWVWWGIIRNKWGKCQCLHCAMTRNLHTKMHQTLSYEAPVSGKVLWNSEGDDTWGNVFNNVAVPYCKAMLLGYFPIETRQQNSICIQLA